MVGDSVSHDIEGALGVGMRGVLLHRSETPTPRAQEPRPAACRSFGRCATVRSALE